MKYDGYDLGGAEGPISPKHGKWAVVDICKPRNYSGDWIYCDLSSKEWNLEPVPNLIICACMRSMNYDARERTNHNLNWSRLAINLNKTLLPGGKLELIDDPWYIEQVLIFLRKLCPNAVIDYGTPEEEKFYHLLKTFRSYLDDHEEFTIVNGVARPHKGDWVEQEPYIYTVEQTCVSWQR